jgi:hypothetical protein
MFDLLTPQAPLRPELAATDQTVAAFAMVHPVFAGYLKRADRPNPNYRDQTPMQGCAPILLLNSYLSKQPFSVPGAEVACVWNRRTKEWVFAQYLAKRGGVLNRLRMPVECTAAGSPEFGRRYPNIFDYIKNNVDLKKLDTQEKIRAFLDEKQIQMTSYHAQQEKDAEERLSIILEQAVIDRESGKVQDDRTTLSMRDLGLDKPAPAGSMTPAPPAAEAGEADKAKAALPPGLAMKDVLKASGVGKTLGVPEEKINAAIDAILAAPGATAASIKSALAAKVSEWRSGVAQDMNSAAANESPSLALPPLR